MKVVVAAIVLVTHFAFAQNNGQQAQDPEQFKKHKEEILAETDQRIANMNEFKSCVGGANGRDDMRNCWKNLKQERMEMKGEMMQKKMNRMQDRMNRMQQKQQQQGSGN